MEERKQTVLAAFRLIFRPIARILLLAGITWKEIAEVCKATLVEVATDDFGIKGRPTNVSRVAILTGFTRKEVARLRTGCSMREACGVRRFTAAFGVVD